VPALDQDLDQLDHLGHVPGGARLVGGRQAAEGVVRVVQLALEVVGQRVPGDAGRLGLGQDLVVDVGDVGDDGDLVAQVRQPAAQDVEDDLLADVPDVRRRLHGEAAVVDRHPARHHGLEVADRARAGVVDAETAHGRASARSSSPVSTAEV
jgi:hypothetical protein